MSIFIHTGHKLVFYPTGFAKGQLLAVDPGAKGESADTHIKWRLKRSVANKPSILLIKDHIYMIADGGVASCVEAKSGKVIWSERVGGNYSASPVTDGKRIFFLSEEGKTTVGQAADTDTLVASANAYINALNKMIIKRKRNFAPDNVEKKQNLKTEKMKGI